VPDFLGGFVTYLKRRTDCPADFHIHAAMAALAAALGNRVWCDGWARAIYPNLWIVILAPSGFGKSVPLDMSEALVRMAGLGPNILPDSFSQEALYTVLSKTPSAIFYLQEFSAFLGALQKDYNQGLVPWLTKIFDVPDVDTRVLMREVVVLKKPCLTMLGASSPDWFAETYRASLLRGGFLARILFCPSVAAGDYVGHPGPRDAGVEAGLADHLRRVAQLAGRADLSSIWAPFNAWDRAARGRLREDCPPEFTGMRSRAGLLVLKAAMLFHASSDPTNLRVTVRDLDNAINYIERCQDLAETYLSQEVASDRHELNRLRLLEIVRRSGGRIPWSKALMNSHLSARDFGEAVLTLEQSERLVVERGTGKQRHLSVSSVHTNGTIRAEP